MTVFIGWWIIPLVITLGTFSWAISVPMKRSGDYSFDLMPLFRVLAALIASLISWLIWALVF